MLNRLFSLSSFLECGALFSGVLLLRRSAPRYSLLGRKTQLERRGSRFDPPSCGVSMPGCGSTRRRLVCEKSKPFIAGSGPFEASTLSPKGLLRAVLNWSELATALACSEGSSLPMSTMDCPCSATPTVMSPRPLFLVASYRLSLSFSASSASACSHCS